jgi:hypothetical protein
VENFAIRTHRCVAFKLHIDGNIPLPEYFNDDFCSIESSQALKSNGISHLLDSWFGLIMALLIADY